MRPRRGEPGYVRRTRRVPPDYCGVRYNEKRKKWRAKIKVNGINYVIGFFDQEVDAAGAYQEVKQAHESGIDITMWGMSHVLD